MIGFGVLLLVWFFGSIALNATGHDDLSVFAFLSLPLYLVWLLLRGGHNLYHALRYGQEAPSIRAAKEKRLIAESQRKSELTQLLLTHKRALRANYLRLVSHDSYGNDDFSKWFTERDYFIEKVLKPKLGPRPGGMGMPELQKFVDEAALDYAYEVPDNFGVDSMSPLEFEQFCASLLQSAGWQTKLTKASGDQGVDVIADKGSVRLAVQCKKYASPVGNAAVQEVIAGMQFVSAAYGAVVTNSSFTPSAVELANVANIALLHHSELSSIDSVLKLA